MRGNRSNRAIYRLIAALAAATLVFGAPTAALAQQVTPTDDQYERGVVGAAEPSEPSAGAETGTPESTDTLPFTGLDLVAIAAIGVGLVGAGFVIRHVSRAGSTQA